MCEQSRQWLSIGWFGTPGNNERAGSPARLCTGTLSSDCWTNKRSALLPSRSRARCSSCDTASCRGEREDLRGRERSGDRCCRSIGGRGSRARRRLVQLCPAQLHGRRRPDLRTGHRRPPSPLRAVGRRARCWSCRAGEGPAPAAASCSSCSRGPRAAALVFTRAEPILSFGVVLGAELFGVSIPVVEADETRRALRGAGNVVLTEDRLVASFEGRPHDRPARTAPAGYRVRPRVSMTRTS